MSTRSTSDKSEVDDLCKSAIENQNRSKSKTSITVYTTPTGPSKSVFRQINLPLNDSVITKDQASNLIGSPESDFDNSGDITIQPADNSNNTVNDKQLIKIKTKNGATQSIRYTKICRSCTHFRQKKYSFKLFYRCEEAKSILPDEAESQLTKIIRTRIVGEARRTIQGEDFDSVAQLINYLKQIYGPSKNIYQLQGELDSVYQKNEEDVVTYANWVKILGKQILEAYKISGNTLPSHNIKISLEKDMCKFIRGLKPEIEHRITRNLGVQETVADALRIEGELRSMSDLRQGHSVKSGQNKSRGIIINSGGT